MNDILGVMMKAGALSHDEMVNQLMVFLATGQETTATATTWAIYCLCRDQVVQKRLRDEIRFGVS